MKQRVHSSCAAQKSLCVLCSSWEAFALPIRGICVSFLDADQHSKSNFRSRSGQIQWRKLTTIRGISMPDRCREGILLLSYTLVLVYPITAFIGELESVWCFGKFRPTAPPPGLFKIFFDPPLLHHPVSKFFLTHRSATGRFRF